MVAALKGTAANMLAGMTATQMDNYNCLIERLRNRYDPSERESTYHTQLSTQTRHHSECPDEFAEAITLLAKKPHPTHEVGIAEDDPITACITDRFCAGQSDPELGRHLSLYPSRVLSDFICVCVRWGGRISCEALAMPKLTMAGKRFYE